MDQRRRRRRSKDLPPHLSELMDKPKDHSASFIREFDSREHRMRQIAEEFGEITAEVRKMQKKKRLAAGIGALILARLVVATAVAVALAVKAADGEARMATRSLTATSTTKWTEAPMILAAVGRQAGVAGVGSLGIVPMILVAALALVAAILTENISIEKVKALKDLEEIKRTCETLEQRSADLQAGQTLRDMEDLLGRVPAERREIIMLSGLCSTVVGDCEMMNEKLRDVTEK